MTEAANQTQTPNAAPNPEAEPMTIDIWSDVVCPFCYIGKRHLELALDEFPHAADVTINWHSFELDPQTKAQPGTDLIDMIAAKYGSTREQAIAQHEQMEAQAAAVGLDFNWRAATPGNTFDAHRLIQLADTLGLADAAEERFKKAYFSEGVNVEDHAELRRLAAEIGLPSQDVDRVLDSEEFAREVRSDEAAAQRLGVTGVPFFVVDNKYGISGAQPVDYFKAALDQVWQSEHAAAPVLKDPLAGASGATGAAGTSAGDADAQRTETSAPACGIDGCN